MSSERIIGSYQIQFIKKHKQTYVYVSDLRTGEKFEFKTWIDAWLFLESFINTNNNHNKASLSSGVYTNEN